MQASICGSLDAAQAQQIQSLGLSASPDEAKLICLLCLCRGRPAALASYSHKQLMGLAYADLGINHSSAGEQTPARVSAKSGGEKQAMAPHALQASMRSTSAVTGPSMVTSLS